jgi:hypothetical protein
MNLSPDHGKNFNNSLNEQLLLMTLHGKFSCWMNADFVGSSQEHANTTLCQETDHLLILIDEYLIASLQHIGNSPATAVQLCLMCLLPA